MTKPPSNSGVFVLGIRHHGPGSARMVRHALRTLKPDAVLIEGPPDAADVLHFAGSKEMKPPVALLVYEPENPEQSVYYPFAVFSPEWQAIRWGLENERVVRFIDLPVSLRVRRPKHADLLELVGPDAESDDHDDADDNADESTEASQPAAAQAGAPAPLAPITPATPGPTDPSAPPTPPRVQRLDPLEALARAAGFPDGEAWWGRLIEERRAEDDPVGFFDAIREAMASTRSDLGPNPPTHDHEEPAREAHMRRAIRQAMKEGYERIAVVCGAWHAPVLSAEALAQHTAKADDEILKGLAKRKTASTWIPWTYDRLSFESGYGAGVQSPGWYEHLWIHHEHLSERWLTRVARLMRDEDMDASPASVIESVRLADTLASLRGRSIPGLAELTESTLANLCHGNPLPLRVIERKLIIGECLGEVPADAPSVPLQRDLAAQQKSLRLKVSADTTELDLDQRKEGDLARSRFLHRLKILKIDWGEVQAHRSRTSTFHEVWQLQWEPELAVSVIEAARWGNTVEEAAAAFVVNQAVTATSLVELTAMLDHVLLADLPAAVGRLVDRVQELSAVATDVGHLMEALPSLITILRYGNVRKTDAALVEPVVEGMVARVCAGLLPACGSLDDDSAETMRDRINLLHSSLATLDRAEYLDDWKHELRRLGEAEIHGLVAGRAWRILLDTASCSVDDAAARLSLGLSPGNDPEKASNWLEGFLGGSGMILVHDDRLLGIVDTWVCSLPRDIFESICPIARRTFSTFEKPERRSIGEKIRRGSTTSPETAPAIATDDYDPVRGALVEPVIRLILREPAV